MGLSMPAAKRRLAKIWLIGAAVVFFVVLAMSVVPDDPDFTSKLWAWFLPTVTPTLSLIVGVLVLDATGKGRVAREVDPFLLDFAAWLSLFYLALVGATLLLTPFSPRLLDSSQLWLAPLQGLVSAALGAFFVQRDADQSRNRRSTDRTVSASLAPTPMRNP